ncbi:sugar transferase [Patescibacteria group bacterium]|nr:sugar transferase [Patescibacteria group bacterium]
MIKRIFDICFSLIGIIILSPVFIIITMLIKITSNGPVIYKGIRIGKNKKPFNVYKFRTMVLNANKIGGPSTPNNDIRLTKTGKFLRKYKIDELPQLFNVIKGEMSLVGPRPEVPEYAKLYKEDEQIIFNIRPGITDLASLWNSNEGEILKNSHDPEKTYLEEIRPKKVKLQIKYVKQMSFLNDLKIIFKTIKKIIKN